MRKAYDTILSDYVDADTAAKNGGFEQYRYECACCWEEVHICAADSRNQVTHFRHRYGNNNVECENYLGNRSAIISNAQSRRYERDKIEFYFSSSTKVFSVGVKFNAKEISDYNQNEVCFQISDSLIGKPIISVPITITRFLPDVSEIIPISKFSWEYYISPSSDVKHRKYEVFRKDARGYLYPSFFKIQVEDDAGDYQAKLIHTENLYTNTSYLIVFSHSSHFPLSLQNDAVVGKVIKFRTMDKDFTAFVVRFDKKTSRIEQQLKAWNYKLESNESLTLLWPPSQQIDGSLVTSAENAFIYSSFELQAHGNTNAHSSDICKLDNVLSKISNSGTIKIFKKNAELTLRKIENLFIRYQDHSVTQLALKYYVAHDDGAYLFNRKGVIKINRGISLPLTISSIVKHYSFGYLDCIITALDNTHKLIGSLLINDIKKNYKRVEKFNWNDFESLDLSQDTFTYIETCKKTGMINSAVKCFIKEGRI